MINENIEKSMEEKGVSNHDKDKIRTELDMFALAKVIHKLREENKRYKEVLEFYANQDNYSSSKEWYKLASDIILDGGKLARECLGK